MKKNRTKVRVAGIVLRKKRMLLINHRKNGESYWVLPGGGVDFREPARKGLEREFREELGVRVDAGSLVFADEVILPAGSHNLDLYFLCRTGSLGRVKLEKGSAVAGYGFFSDREIRTMDIRPPLNRILVRLIRDGSVKNRFHSFSFHQGRSHSIS